MGGQPGAAAYGERMSDVRRMQSAAVGPQARFTSPLSPQLRTWVMSTPKLAQWAATLGKWSSTAWRGLWEMSSNTWLSPRPCSKGGDAWH